jgi:WD40 repeat protein
MKKTTSVAFSPNGRILASGASCGTTITLWDLRSGKELKTLSGNFDGVSSVAFSPDGRTLASGSDNGTIKLWDIDSGKELPTVFNKSI